jgi:tetraacyldisaccharide 4'-kinase
MLIILLKRLLARPKIFNIAIISIGNLIIGGSGKTPIAIALARRYDNVAIVLRGYKRQSKGMLVISNKNQILQDIEKSGDEAMLLAQSLPHATIIVSEEREEGIQKAMELGCKIVFLDDGFSKYHIAKFDILIRPKNEPTNVLCLPSGGYREPKMMYSMAQLILNEEHDFKRKVSFTYHEQTIDTLPKKLLLLTAISKPQRLLEFLPQNTKMVAFEDHHHFTQKEMDDIKRQYKDYAMITTQKDWVKLSCLKLETPYLMDLNIEFLNDKKLEQIDDFIAKFKKSK